MPATKPFTLEQVQEYDETWKNHLKVGAGRRLNEKKRFIYFRRFRNPEELEGIAHGNKGVHGAPPANSTYRCQGICRRTGERCKDWAMRGQRTCKCHGGRGRNRDGRNTLRNPHRKLRRLPVMYTKYLGTKLNDKILEAASAKDRLDVSAELDLVRVTAVDAVQLYDLTQQLPDNGDKTLHQRLEAGAIVRAVMQEVVNTADKMMKIEAARNDRLSVASLHVVVTQIVEMAYEAFGEDNIETVKKFADMIKEIRLPSSEVMGTNLTPDQDVRDMDSTIPIV